MAENPEKGEESRNVRKNKRFCSWKWCWWNPPQEAIVAEFRNETSLHGLHYIGQPKRHISERIFWIVVFLVGVIAAAFLVYAMIQSYLDTPVVVSFQSKEQPIDTIPFPAVTLCNINQDCWCRQQQYQNPSEHVRFSGGEHNSLRSNDCMFDGEKLKCSEEIQTVITALGKCCTFNMLPLPLILKNP
ncbi:unnamed protein product [Orchesella dallaii]|uniref:Sodium channel protein Nach n=1 Tax=Orchesella dallaii TaxID=48710 RepID=A0ABP1RID3_9HEXA